MTKKIYMSETEPNLSMTCAHHCDFLPVILSGSYRSIFTLDTLKVNHTYYKQKLLNMDFFLNLVLGVAENILSLLTCLGETSNK